jgi:hypothetical protein
LKAAMPSRSRNSRTRAIVQVPPESLAHRMRFSVTATSR